MASDMEQAWRATVTDERQKDFEEQLLQLAGPERPSEEADDVGTLAWWDRLVPWTPTNDSIATWGNREEPLAPSESPRFCDTCYAIFQDCSAERWARVPSPAEFHPGLSDELGLTLASIGGGRYMRPQRPYICEQHKGVSYASTFWSSSPTFRLGACFN
ncbi:hypothetical protein LTR95_016204, partial [Oleoguttula sp. CCFEE 5521]